MININFILFFLSICLKIAGVIFILTLFTIRVIKEKDGYTIQWGIIPLIRYYKERKYKNNSIKEKL